MWWVLCAPPISCCKKKETKHDFFQPILELFFLLSQLMLQVLYHCMMRLKCVITNCYLTAVQPTCCSNAHTQIKNYSFFCSQKIRQIARFRCNTPWPGTLFLGGGVIFKCRLPPPSMRYRRSFSDLSICRAHVVLIPSVMISPIMKPLGGYLEFCVIASSSPHTFC